MLEREQTQIFRIATLFCSIVSVITPVRIRIRKSPKVFAGSESGIVRKFLLDPNMKIKLGSAALIRTNSKSDAVAIPVTQVDHRYWCHGHGLKNFGHGILDLKYIS
jgi:hypothetical protein